MVSIASPRLAVLRPSAPLEPVTAVALVLHGGREQSRAAVQPSQLSVRRMQPFARSLAALGGEGLAVWSLQYRVRGWNGAEMSPVADARWALEQIARRHGEVPVALVGHSMGARAAVHVASHPQVIAVAALAPWLPAGEPHEGVAGKSVLVVHGLLDTTTSPHGSLEWARLAATVTDHIWRVEVRRERHAMLWRARLWHRLTTDFVAGALGYAELPPLLTDSRSGPRSPSSAPSPSGARLQIRV